MDFYIDVLELIQKADQQNILHTYPTIADSPSFTANELYKTYISHYPENKQKQAKQAEKQAKQAKQQGKLEGMAEAIINNIKSLMQNLNMTAENAIKALNLPPEKHEFYLAQLQNT